MTASLALTPVAIEAPRATLSLDLEYDYGGSATAALGRFETVVRFVEKRDVPLTVFVEGRILREHPGIVDLLRAPGIIPAQHCYDHREPGDCPEDVERGRELFAERLSVPPEGYRAHTFRYSRQLIETLLALGYAWDSSFLPARFGYGAGTDPEMRRALAAGPTPVICHEPETGRRLVELPVGTLRGLGVPFIQSYQLLAGATFSAALRRTFGLPRLFVHDLHMVDLFRRTKSLGEGAVPRSAAALFRLSWLGKGEDSLALLGRFVDACRAEGRDWVAMPDLVRQILARHE